MPLYVSNEKFERAHRAFKQHMLRESGGIPFTNFQHPFLVKTEIEYKWEIYSRARHVLNLGSWKQWKKTRGKILHAVKEACLPGVSMNLLEHRYGSQSYSESALYKVKRPEQINGMENLLYDFFHGGPTTPAKFGPRFDTLARYLRDERLGCKWAFLAYLAFLISQQVYFPILPTRFDSLMHFYGVDESISGNVSWERYSILLKLAEELKSRLAMYGQINAIEIQSYMWVVSYLIEAKKVPKKKMDTTPDFNSELETRRNRAKERERIGLLGEEFIYEREMEKLKKAGRSDLANQVEPTFLCNVDFSFDILSFNPDGTERHIEVKTTARSQDNDDGFWLSEKERVQAEQDACWVVYRVWNIDLSPKYENLGNIVRDKNENWEMGVSSWYVRCKRSAKRG